ncbi:MAG: histidinol-phosphate transaminase [Methanophagales archaeon ANME-1-THS]|nr:MAG: histidinol-phosphate transaminase [Methanophagales archaeon ANME-1-THS]
MTITMRCDKRSPIQELEEYKPGKLIKGAIKLSSNENPLGPSPEVVKAIANSLENEDLKLSVYPWEGNEDELRAEIARYVGFGVKTIVIGAGIDGVLDTLVKIFLGNGNEAIIPVPTFSLYESLVIIAGGTPRYIPRRRNEHFEISVAELLAACNDRTRMIFLSSPNNPTGNCIAEKEVREIAEAMPEAMVAIDEAYVEFADSSLVNLVREYENVVVLRTFSKAFGLAGLRVGYAIIPEWLAGMYKKVAIPFSVNSVAIQAAIAALKDKKHLRRSIKLVKSGRTFLEENLQKICKVYPSEANFVLADLSPRKSSTVCDALEKKGITVRDCASFRGAGDSFIRISVGTQEENEKLLEALKHVLSAKRF